MTTREHIPAAITEMPAVGDPEVQGYRTPTIHALGDVATATLGQTSEGLDDLFGNCWPRNKYALPAVQVMSEIATETSSVVQGNAI